MSAEKTIEYYKNNAEEDYLRTPISVLRYITELEEMQANKQTCGFCVEPISLDHNNIPESVYNGNIKESDAKQPNQDEFPCVDCLTPAECGDCEQCLNELFKKPTIHNIFEQPQVKEQPKDNGLREAAEKVVYEWHNSVGEECIDAAMVELVKVLNSKKH